VSTESLLFVGQLLNIEVVRRVSSVEEHAVRLARGGQAARCDGIGDTSLHLGASDARSWRRGNYTMRGVTARNLLTLNRLFGYLLVWRHD
jgi:hypothetical protein